MSKNKAKFISRLYGIILSASIIVAGACLIVGCLLIYYSGNGYSRQLVSETFSKICIPIYICLALVIGGFLVNAVIPQKQKNKLTKDYRQILKNMYTKKDLKSADTVLSKQICYEHKKRNIYKTVLVSITIAAAFVFFSYALNSENFHQTEITNSMIKAMCVLLPCVAVVFGISLLVFYTSNKSIKNEIELVKQLPNIEKSLVTVSNVASENKIKVLKWCLLGIAVAVLFFGAFMGGFADVLTKAINICTECIGLG